MENKSRLNKKIALLISLALAVVITSIIFFIIPLKKDLFQSKQVAKLYYVDNISIAHQALIDGFNEEYKGEIEVVPVNIPFEKFTTNERKELLARSLRSHSDQIDIFAVDLIWGARFAKWAYPLNSFFNDSTLSKIDKKALHACYYNNQLIAFPLYLDLGIMYYRKNIIEALPDGDEIEKMILKSISWQNFIELGKRFSNSEKPFYIFPGDNFEGMICSFHEMLTFEESEFIFGHEKVNINNKYSEKALQQLTDFIHTLKLTPKDVLRFDEYKSYVYANDTDAIFLRGWTGYHKQYPHVIKDTSDMNDFVIAPLPHFEGSPKSGVFGGWNLMIARDSNHKKEALEFIKYTTRKEVQENLYVISGYIPVNLEVYQDTTFLKKYKNLGFINKILKLGKHRPFRKDYTRLSDIMSHYFHKALKNEISVKEALAKTEETINSGQIFIK